VDDEEDDVDELEEASTTIFAFIVLLFELMRGETDVDVCCEFELLFNLPMLPFKLLAAK
jgi:hypothetical protein